MLVRKFTFGEDEEYGGEGWLPSWMKGANAMRGQGCAHDILEHHPNMGLGAEAEFHALGACYFVRGETGYFPISGAHSLANDFPSILGRVHDGVETLRCPPNTRPLHSDVFGDADDALMSIVDKGMGLARREFTYRDEELSLPFDASRRVLGWMRRGYRYAAKRYAAGGQFQARYLFDEITKAVDQKGRFAELGMEMTVRVNLRRANVKVICNDPSDEHW